MNHTPLFDRTPEERKKVWDQLISRLEQHYQDTDQSEVAPTLDLEAILEHVTKFDFEKPLKPMEAIGHVLEGLDNFHVHTPHPSYYGLFNPRPTFAGIVSDLITAVYNPQMAAWSHAPFATEAENHCIREMGAKFGYEQSDGTFCTGGAEANLTATLCALHHRFPEYGNAGLHGLTKSPVMYCSEEAHHSVIRSARVCGLGLNAVRKIPCIEKQQINVAALADAIDTDIQADLMPFMVIANAGSTGTGAIDPLDEIATICARHSLWFHVDAAYGGAIVVDPKMKILLRGIEYSDSLTIDIHKWFSAPMGTGLFITQHTEILSRTFRIIADYMPKEAKDMEVVDPYSHSLQWSRRFTGLRFYMTLLMIGWNGLAEMVRNMTHVGDMLKTMLMENGWEVHNDTQLPILCFTDRNGLLDNKSIYEICHEVVSSGRAWISIYHVGETLTLRACITNYDTHRENLEELISILNEIRARHLREM